VLPFPNGITPVNYDVTFRRNLFPNLWQTGSFVGIRPVSAPNDANTDFTYLHTRKTPRDDMDFVENGIPLGISDMTREATNGRYPQQYEPAALWQAQGDNPWGWTTVSATDPYALDLTLEGDSPVKAIGSDGTDPGVAWSIIETVRDSVRYYDPQDIVWPNSDNISLDYE
jgi:hypothetical protein